MTGFVVVVYHQVADPDTMAAYAALAVPALAAHGAVFLARKPGSEVSTREAGVQERVVLLQFPSKAQALQAWDSAEYQAAYALIASSVTRDVRFVESAA